jgi:hypothetical protein
MKQISTVRSTKLATNKQSKPGSKGPSDPGDVGEGGRRVGPDLAVNNCTTRSAFFDSK